MKFRVTYGNLWRVSAPLMLAGVGSTIVNVTDTVFLAQYGVHELAAMGLAEAFTGAALFLISGLAIGIHIILSRRVGQGDPASVGRIFNQGLVWLCLIALLSATVLKFGFPIYGARYLLSPEIYQRANDFIQIIAFAFVIMVANMLIYGFLISISQTRVIIGATVILVTVNVALDYLLIFGEMGFPRMGIKGAAWSSLITDFLVLVFQVVVIFRKGYARHYKLFRFNRSNFRYNSMLGSLSWPIALESMIQSGGWVLFFVIIEQLGSTALASATIVFNVFIVLLIPMTSFEETTSTMAANLIGQGKRNRIRLLIRRTARLNYLLVLPFVLVLLAFPELVMKVFTEDADLIRVSIGPLRVIAVTILILIPTSAYSAAMEGVGDTGVSFVIELLATVLSLVWLYVTAMVLHQSLTVIWMAETLSCLTVLILSLRWFRSGKMGRRQF